MLDDVLKNYEPGTNRTLDALSKDPAAASALFSELEKCGLRDISSERLGGTTAIVVRASKDEVLRVCKDGIEEARDTSDFKIWQPSHDLGTIAGYKVEIYSRAHPLDKAMESGEISARDAFHLTQQLIGECARDGKLLWDLKPDNLTLAHTKTGAPVLFVLDEGAVAPMSEMHGGKIGNDTHTNLDKFTLELSDLARKAGYDDAPIKANPEAYLASLRDSGRDVENREAIQKSYHSIRVVNNPYAPLLNEDVRGAYTQRIRAQQQQRQQAVYTGR